MDVTPASRCPAAITFAQAGLSKTGVTTTCQNPRHSVKFRDSNRVDLSYCRVSTTVQDLTRQIDAMRAAGVAEEHIYVDKRTGATMDRDGLTSLLGFARHGDRINLLTLDRLGRNMRETLNLVHDLTQRGIFLRTFGDKLAVDTSDPGPGTDMAIALLAMFAQMDRIYMLERAVGARAARQARGLPAGRPAKLNATTRAGAAQRIGDGAIPEQVASRPRHQPLHAVPGAAQASRGHRCRTGSAARLISGPGRIPAGQR
jgi:DNA invertase Pin-like site-specific DNA recombinase